MEMYLSMIIVMVTLCLRPLESLDFLFSYLNWILVLQQRSGIGVLT